MQFISQRIIAKTMYLVVIRGTRQGSDWTALSKLPLNRQVFTFDVCGRLHRPDKIVNFPGIVNILRRQTWIQKLWLLDMYVHDKA